MNFASKSRRITCAKCSLPQRALPALARSLQNCVRRRRQNKTESAREKRRKKPPSIGRAREGAKSCRTRLFFDLRRTPLPVRDAYMLQGERGASAASAVDQDTRQYARKGASLSRSLSLSIDRSMCFAFSGSGKSVALASVVQWARQAGWITLYARSPRLVSRSFPLRFGRRSVF